MKEKKTQKKIPQKWQKGLQLVVEWKVQKKGGKE